MAFPSYSKAEVDPNGGDVVPLNDGKAPQGSEEIEFEIEVQQPNPSDETNTNTIS